MKSTGDCPLCGAETGEILTTCLRRGTGTVFLCGACDHGFLITGTSFDAKEYYATEYRKEVSHAAAAAATDPRELFDVYSQYQDERLRIISPYLSRSTTVLEVGASAGQFLTHIKDKVVKTDAIELDKACSEFLRVELGIDADSEFLRESRFASERYDVVCSFQVLEHVENPVTFLSEIRQSMKDGGRAFIEVPNLHDSLLTVWNVENYRAFYYHSAHLHYFTETSLRKVAQSAGFRPEETEVVFTQDYNLLNHLNWLMNGTPQATCTVGLSPVDLSGPNNEISRWLDDQMKVLNAEYISKLIHAKSTSNMMMVLSLG